MAVKMRVLLAITFLIVCVISDQWFMPDSNLISDTEFTSKIVEDKFSYKFVKYFTPHCPYCRYLKAVFDQLKHTKEWCFKIYDFNCQWYPQFCMSNVRSSSFPYTAIHDQTGAMIEEIHGFYPEPIISTIFNRIQERCLEARKAADPNYVPETHVPAANSEVQVPSEPSTQQIAAATASITPIQIKQPAKLSAQISQQSPKTSQNLSSQPSHQQKSQIKVAASQTKTQLIEQKRQMQASISKNQPASPQKQTHQTIKQQSQPTQQNSQVSSDHASQPIKTQTTQKQQNQKQKDIKKAENQQKNGKSYHNYLFYGVTLLCAGYYMYSLHTEKQNPQVKQDIKIKTAQEGEKELNGSNIGNQYNQPQLTMQQSQLLQQIPDQEL